MILNLLVFLLQKKSDGIKRQDINDELLQLRNDVSVLKDDVDNLENALGSLGGHVSTLEDGVGNLKANTCYFDSRFHRLEQSHASMENCLEKVENTRVNFRR
ncbi:uncharacterized protein RVIR1_10540 [Candidatus Rickettsiella viridis]|uniref:Uncharacterized protein n=2 Tax=Candidatus Rickettsiella viridis TaxID=676208 RepID=A0A2Z5UVN7_9COXI|nr:uncharacterized protein RVIR1_10540 [Candidatus Rickettsiella viridis]